MRRQFFVPGHEERNGDQINDGGVDGGKKQEGEHPGYGQAHIVSNQRGMERASYEMVPHVLEHVITDAGGGGIERVDIIQRAGRV